MNYTNIDSETNELIELSGCDKFDDLVEWFGGMTAEEIEAEAGRCWPGDDNRIFSERVFNALSVTEYRR